LIRERIYLDHNASTPLLPEALEEMMPYFKMGNPSSPYYEGQKCKGAIEEARERVASLLGGQPDEIFFTSGGTESNNTVFWECGKKAALITSIEHHSVMRAADRFSRQGGNLHKIPVTRECIVELNYLEETLKKEKTPLVSVMLANNETGAVQPIKEISELVRKYGGTFHCDAVAAIGKMTFELCRIDMLSVSSHKIYGPQGVGALYVKRGTAFSAMLVGGGQEKGKRAGTENVAGIVGFGAACLWAKKNIQSETRRLSELTSFAWETIHKRVPQAVLNVPRAGLIPGTINISFPGYSGEDIIINLDLAGVSVSTGAACSSGVAAESHVLKAMRLPRKSIKSAVRISLGKETTHTVIEKFVAILQETIERLPCSGY